MENSEIIKKRELRKAIIEEDRHKEQTGLLKGIAASLNKPEKDDKAIVDAIKKQGESLEAAISKIPAPEVNVVNDYKELVSLFKENREGQKAIEKALIEQKQATENRPMVDEFIISSHGYNGQDRKAKVVYKPANQITFKK